MKNSSGKNITAVAELIESRQRSLNLSDLHVAAALGCDNPGITGLIKSSTMRVPVSKVPHLAEVLQVQPSVLMRMVLLESSPEMLQAIEACYGPMELTDGEVRLLQSIRKSDTGGEPAIVICDKEAVIALVVASPVV